MPEEAQDYLDAKPIIDMLFMLFKRPIRPETWLTLYESIGPYKNTCVTPSALGYQLLNVVLGGLSEQLHHIMARRGRGGVCKNV